MYHQVQQCNQLQEAMDSKDILNAGLQKYYILAHVNYLTSVTCLNSSQGVQLSYLLEPFNINACITPHDRIILPIRLMTPI